MGASPVKFRPSHSFSSVSDKKGETVGFKGHEAMSHFDRMVVAPQEDSIGDHCRRAYQMRYRPQRRGKNVNLDCVRL